MTSCSEEEPYASFTCKSSAEVNEVITFTNSSTFATIYSWDFGDGNTSTEENPTHSYSNDGNFTVVLTATGDGGENSISKIITVAYPAPVANFTMDKTEAMEGETITFTNSSENATSYSWDFGDDKTSTDENPTHSYLTEGTYTVELTATGDGGSKSITKTITIIKNPNPLLGNWELTKITLNNNEISDFSGSRYFGDKEISGGNWTGDATCSITMGSEHAYVSGAYEISGNSLIYGYSYTAINWPGDATWDKFCAFGIGSRSTTFEIKDNQLIITGKGGYGTTVLTYVKK